MQTLTVQEIDAFSRAAFAGRTISPMNILRLCNLCKDYVLSMQDIEDLKTRAQAAIVTTLQRAEEMVTDRSHRRSLEREVTKVKAQMSQREEWITAAKNQSAILDALTKRLQDIEEAANHLMGEIGDTHHPFQEHPDAIRIRHLGVFLALDLAIHPEPEPEQI